MGSRSIRKKILGLLIKKEAATLVQQPLFLYFKKHKLLLPIKSNSFFNLTV